MDDLLTTEEFADIARAPVSTVRYWRAQRIGPVGFRLGRRVLYRRSDVTKWLDERRKAEMRARSAS